MAELTEEKQRARAMWATGDYPSIVYQIAELGTHAVERVGIAEGERVLDIGCGPGNNATIAAARTGANVTGLDLTPELLEAARENAAEAGVEIDWIEGDAERLPFDDDGFDVVISTVGIMFAPDHRRAAQEAARVLRPGGRLAIASWRPEGSVGRFFATTSKHFPPPPEGFQPPVLWGTEDHVHELFDGTGVELRFEKAEVKFKFDSADEATEFYETRFGPVITAKRMLEPDGKWEALRGDLREMFEREIAEAGAGGYPGEYLLVLGEKAG
ncbi:MAG: class I SAM-dependent methyltransferase [Solirubrobacterales bacterium]